MHTVDAENRRAFLVGVDVRGGPARRDPAWSIQDSLAELGRLADTAGLAVVGSTWQNLERPNASTFIGSGKVREIAEAVAAENAAYVLFDDELSPGQQRNLSKTFGEGVRLLDRTRLILDIFSQHAHSREGKVQVELAQYQYLLPRLAGLRTGLAQQVGGAGAGPVGVRGPGETQLELDRRQVRRRIQRLREELEVIRSNRHERGRQRARTGLPVVTMVGYTNAGKSSLLNALTGAGVLVEDKLFATLDPTTRRLKLPDGREALLTDTVGFIRKLPHDLVASFRATLEGIEEASLLVHIVDASHDRPADQIRAVEKVLGETGVLDRPRLMVWNKIDLVAGGIPPNALQAHHPDSVAISALTGMGLPELLGKIAQMLDRALEVVETTVPWRRYELVRQAIAQGNVLEREDLADGVRIRAAVPAELAARLRNANGE